MTENKEDYLKAIYELGGVVNQVNNKEICTALGVSAPSVSEMVKKLLDEEYIYYTPYKGIRLTQHGAETAVKIIRRHRLWEVFLVEHLGYSWDEVHEEAERLEHVTSSLFENRLEKYLGFPKTCPHGSPIPPTDICFKSYRTLDSLEVGETAVVRRINDEKELLKYVVHLGFSIGDNITIIDLAPYNGPITFNNSKNNIIIGREAAKKIYVD
ncbi:iron dependent repressor, DNA binding domain protein [Clostridiales bacterium oral taxon 876 str. F0540]|nr:iron dependent repressor, DNA binding domain protein [Clostridiales bacterium oral taxon 876 str. F0540]